LIYPTSSFMRQLRQWRSITVIVAMTPNLLFSSLLKLFNLLSIYLLHLFHLHLAL
jgi:hypothetical protein